MAPKKEKIEEAEGEFVQVKKEDLTRLFDTIEKQSKDIDLLYKASDKVRLSKAQSEGGEMLIHTAKVSKWDDTEKYVIGWKLTKNRCDIVNGRMIEEQQTQVVLDDGEVLEVPLLEFYRKIIRKDSGEIISTNKKIDANGSSVNLLTIQFKDGKKIEINSNFIN